MLYVVFLEGRDIVFPSNKVEGVAVLQLIKGLEAARGNGTSMISLIMPPKDQVGAGLLRGCMCVSVRLIDGLWLHQSVVGMYATVLQVRGQVQMPPEVHTQAHAGRRLLSVAIVGIPGAEDAW